MLFPRRASDMAQSLVAAARESGCLPRWSVVNGQTSEMVGDPSDALLASTYAFGARAFDARAALAAMVRGATSVCHTSNGDYTEREGLADYLRQGFVGYEHNVGSAAHTVAHDRPWGAAATTLEYATADFAISRLAAGLGDRPTADAFLARSGNWRTVLNPSTRTVEPRYSGGRWVPGYDPRRGAGFVEGNAAQYTWAVPHDPSGLFGALGGPGAASRRLDRFFGRLNSGPRAPFAFLGNEPSLGAPWLYDWLGTPYKTQAVVRRALTSLYRLAPGGMPGNDDGGTLSAWWVLGAIGLYPAVPGEDVLALGSPLFRRATLVTGRGAVTIDAPAARSDRPYVHSVRIGDRTWTRPWLRFGEIAGGASIAFDLAARPEVTWGADPRDAPPSFGPTARASRRSGSA
jgi:predicted alpha-1,2-mannosidase